MNQKEQWWKEAVVYQIYPKSFMDSDGDGVGDIRGIIDKLDYIEELGVNVIWICPVYKSPMDDNGYDIADYYHVDPLFGKDEDLEELIEKASERDIWILMDLVVNHTSDEHEWFQKALTNPQGEYADYYVIKETEDGNPPNNWRSYFGGPAWEQIEGTNKYYLHAFGKKQPDLNWENEKVREEIYQMVNYWLDKGLGGFRIDAIGNIKKNLEFGTFRPDGEDGLCYIGDWILNQPGIEVFLNELKERTFLPHNSMTVAEANVPDELLGQFIGENGFFSMIFDFSYTDIDVPATGEWFKPYPWTVEELKEHIFHSQIETLKRGWGAVYLENHDQCRSINKYIPEKEINFYSKTMLASLFLGLRGTPFIYQGEEIGMENIKMDSLADYDDIATYSHYQRAIQSGMEKERAFDLVSRRSRDNSRTPMQWNSGEQAGFTTAAKAWLKVNPNKEFINVEEEKDREASVLHFYQKMIHLRREGENSDLLIYGDFRPYETKDSKVIAYERVLGEKRLLAIHNFQNRESRVMLAGEVQERIIGNYKDLQMNGNYCIIRPYECLILKMEENR